MRPKGYLALVLHAHLPFVRHPEHEDFLEEDWLYEAITECYVPLIRLFESLARDGVPFRLTLSVSPTLASMLQDPLLQSRYVRRLERLTELAERELERARLHQPLHRLALMYRERFETARAIWDACGGDLTVPLRRLQHEGRLEIIASAATHAFLPLMNGCESSVRAQVRVGYEHSRRVFGQTPHGMWLPECGYEPAIEPALKECGIQYFILDAHGLLFAAPRPRFGVYAPVKCPSGVAAFARDIEASRQVWSALEGYPGDPVYREFYRDVGYELDYDYIRPYLHSDGVRRTVGLKYYRITGPTEDKELYDPEAARARADQHAEHFLTSRIQQVKHLFTITRKEPIIVAPYDAELFGHWWFEGPDWLELLIRRLCAQDILEMITPADYLERHPDLQPVQPAASSWGWKGYNEMWLEGSNDWIYPHLHRISQHMASLARRYPHAHGLLRRALNQAAREVLLAQGSDWAFIMKTGTFTDYAARRTREHVERFERLSTQIRSGGIDDSWLAEVEARDNIFPELDYSVFR